MTPFDDFCGTEAEPYSPVHEKPPLRKEIEYQGIQHYHPVEFFGGEEALSLRQELDQQKRKLCDENQVRLIECPYGLEPTDWNIREALE